MSKIRIFGVPWHAANQYEMLKLADKYPVEFTYLINNVRRWSKKVPRPIPEHLKWATYYEKGKYDLAILHIDQQAADPAIGKGQLYRQLNEVITDIPKIVINHGTPMWDENFTEDLVINGGTVHTSRGPRQMEGIKTIVGDNFMVVNSYTAVERWGWGYPLIHGMSPEEWWDLPKEPRVTVVIGPGGLDKYYNRTLLSYIKARVKEKSGLDVQHVSVNALTGFENPSFDDYREFLGKSLLFVNPTLDSPMPRSRTEAMLSGCLVLSSKYHGFEEYIEHGVDGFVVPDNPLSYAETIDQLLNNHYEEVVEMGQRGKLKAQKLFHVDRYHEDLYKIITHIVNGKKLSWNGKKIWDA